MRPPPPVAPQQLAAFAPQVPARETPAPQAAASSFDVQQNFVTNTAAPVQSTTSAPSMPIAPHQAAPPPLAPTAPQGAPLRSMAPPPQAQAGGGPTRGDVFLDGTRMGRWVSDNLAREATRPQAGNTGFDPRIGPTWPGTLQGS